MQTRKDWAVSQGLANPGRGRMPKAAVIACDKAEDEGMVFSDTKKRPVKKADKPKAKPVSNDGPSVSSDIDSGLFEPLYPGTWKTADGTKVGNRAVCVNCSTSLNFHRCGSAKALAPNLEIEAVFHYA